MNLFHFKNTNSSGRGFSVVEVIVSAGIFVAAVIAFYSAWGVLTRLEDHARDLTYAGLLLEETGEAMTLFRDLGWDENIAIHETETAYYLSWDGAEYALGESEAVVPEGYARRVTFHEVRRNGSGAYASAGTEDPDSRRILIEIVDAESDEVLVEGQMLVHNSYE